MDATSLTTDSSSSGLVPFELRGGINTPQERLLENIATNIRRPLPQVQPHEPNDQRIAMVGGGPSLVDTLGELRDQIYAGVKVIAVNGSHDWLIERGIRPSAFVMLDARPSNARFVKRWVAGCKYFIASQCDPGVFDALAGADVYIFHCDLGTPKLSAILDRHYFGRYYEVAGGSTVMLRGMLLMRMLGFRYIDMYGFDGCILDGKDHAYPQPENATDAIVRVTARLPGNE